MNAALSYSRIVSLDHLLLKEPPRPPRDCTGPPPGSFPRGPSPAAHRPPRSPKAVVTPPPGSDRVFPGASLRRRDASVSHLLYGAATEIVPSPPQKFTRAPSDRVSQVPIAAAGPIHLVTSARTP